MRDSRNRVEGKKKKKIKKEEKKKKLRTRASNKVK